MEIEYKRKRTLNHRAERACGYRSNLLMMDIKYDFKANPFKEKDGKPVLYPAVVVKETITTDHIVKELSKHSAYSAGCVVGVLQEVVVSLGASLEFWLDAFPLLQAQSSRIQKTGIRFIFVLITC